jgi:hypothetical protein
VKESLFERPAIYTWYRQIVVIDLFATAAWNVLRRNSTIYRTSVASDYLEPMAQAAKKS